MKSMERKVIQKRKEFLYENEKAFNHYFSSLFGRLIFHGINSQRMQR